MTPQELAALPVGSIVRLEGEEGEVVRMGQTVNILWPESKCTNVIDTNSPKWYDFINFLEAEGNSEHA
jgi:hypothetical protein